MPCDGPSHPATFGRQSGRRLLLGLLVGLLVSGCSLADSSGGAVSTEGHVGSASPAGASHLPPLHPSVDDYPEATLRLVGPSGEAVTVAAKVANTVSRRRHGLMEVPVLPEGVGMLFVFAEEQRSGFWMKNTLVPLDIAFFSRDGSVGRILRMEPCRASPCPVYDPAVPYRYALEVPAGWFERVGVGLEWWLELPGDLPPAS